MADTTSQSVFERALVEMNALGKFTASVVASDDGLPIASAPSPSPYDANTVAAMVTLVKGFIQDTQQQLGMADVDEVSIVVSDRSRLICRYFSMGGKWFVLAVIAQPDSSYRRHTRRAIREMTAGWDRITAATPSFS